MRQLEAGILQDSRHVAVNAGRGLRNVDAKVSRAKLGEVVAKLSPCLVVMEACGSSN